MTKQLSVSIVLYQNSSEVELAVASVLNTSLNIILYLVDNSPTDRLKYLASNNRVIYLFNDANLGYGAAHNIAMQKSIAQNVKYHLVMNPDITFKQGTLERIYEFMDQHDDVGSLMPKVFGLDGSVQKLCKLLPTPLNLFGRRFLGKIGWAERMNNKYELSEFNYNDILNVPSLSGCFMFIRTAVLTKAGLFDPRYFMYLEDYDLGRRIHKISKTVFYPEASVIHTHAKESYKSKTLLKIHMRSAISYFNKWGWILDKERSSFNRTVLLELELKKKK